MQFADLGEVSLWMRGLKFKRRILFLPGEATWVVRWTVELDAGCVGSNVGSNAEAICAKIELGECGRQKMQMMKTLRTPDKLLILVV